MEDEDSERSVLPKRKIALYFSILLAIAYLASSLAANITLNGSNRIEFGQGVYNLKACDDFVRVNLSYTAYDSGSNSYLLNQIQLSGFDTSKCKSKYFAIKLTGTSGALDIIHYPSVNPTTVANKIVIHVDENAVAHLVYTYTPASPDTGSIGGDIPVAGDQFQKITYSSGIYTIDLLHPYLQTNVVTGTTFQSAASYAALS